MKYLFKFTVVILLFLSQFNSKFLSSNNVTKSLSTQPSILLGGVSKPSLPTINDNLLLKQALYLHQYQKQSKRILNIGYTVLYVTVQVVAGEKYEFLIKINNTIDEFYRVGFVFLSNKVSSFEISKVSDSEKTKVEVIYKSFYDRKASKY